MINGPVVHKLSVPEDTSDISLGFGAAAQPTIYATSKQGFLFPPMAGQRGASRLAG